MHGHVGREVGPLGEALAANLALVLPNALVLEYVVLEHRAVLVDVRAHGALVSALLVHLLRSFIQLDRGLLEQ